jgi:hypothetical protein
MALTLSVAFFKRTATTADHELSSNLIRRDCQREHMARNRAVKFETKVSDK